MKCPVCSQPMHLESTAHIPAAASIDDAGVVGDFVLYTEDWWDYMDEQFATCENDHRFKCDIVDGKAILGRLI